MPIICMTFKREEIPADAVNVHDVSDSYRNHFAGDNPQAVTLFTYETHNGLCIQDREINGSWDSDFIMTVWNPEKGAPQDITFASTRGWTYPCYGSKPDATPEVMAAYKAYKQKLADEARQAAEARKAAMPAKGKTVKVVKGRKVPVGTEGRVFWTDIREKWFYTAFMKFEGRVGIETAAGRVFTDVGNVEIVS